MGAESRVVVVGVGWGDGNPGCWSTGADLQVLETGDEWVLEI